MNRKVLLLGLDGADWAWLRSPVVEASMPNLQELLRRSTSAPLQSTTPPYTAPAWTSITTGVGPGTHGVFSFTDRSGRPITDRDVEAPRLWDVATAAGATSVVLNFPLTYPAREIQGVLVSGMPAPERPISTHPPELATELAAEGYRVDVAVREGRREPADVFDKLKEMTEARGRAAQRLARSVTWDLFAVVFVLPDRLGHPWWKLMVPGSPHYETKKGAATRDKIADTLVALDRAVGDLLSSLPSSTAVVTCSDHGFGSLDAELFFDLVLAREGLIAGPGRLVRAASALGQGPLGGLAPDWMKRAVRSSSGVSAAEPAARTAPGYESGIRVNDERRRERIVQMLLELRDPRGDLVVESARPREVVYAGPHVDRAVDIVVGVRDEAVELHDGSHAPRPWVSRDRLPWGTHRKNGIVAIDGVDADLSEPSPRVEDVMPTVLGMMGLKARSLDGRALVDDQGAVSVEVENRAKVASAYNESEEAALIEHLRGLGYVE